MTRVIGLAALVVGLAASAGCANPNAQQRSNAEFRCRDRSAAYTVIGSLAGTEVGVQFDCAVAGPRIMRWMVGRDGAREEQQASLRVGEFDRIWERINATGWRNMNDCTGSGGERDPVYDIEVKDWTHQRVFGCVHAGPLPFPYNNIVDELDLRAASIDGPETQGGDD